jgi:hypothetical protein
MSRVRVPSPALLPPYYRDHVSHLRDADGAIVCDRTDGHEHDHRHEHGHSHGLVDHGHSHGLLDRSILRSREG